MKKLRIGLDVGNVILDNEAEKVPFGLSHFRPTTGGALGYITRFEQEGHELHVISKINPGQEAYISCALAVYGIIPHLIKPENVRFCYERSDKGSIAAGLHLDIFLDDRHECLNSLHRCGVRYPVKSAIVREEKVTDGYPEIMFENLTTVYSWQEFCEFVWGIQGV